MLFDIKNPAEWSHIMQGEKLHFEPVAARRVRLSFNATEEITVWCADNEEMDKAVLIGSGRSFDTQFSVAGPAFVEARTTKGAIIFVKGHARSQLVEPAETPSYTNIAPRGRPSELERMMYVMRLNERKREAKLEAEIARLASASIQTEKTDLNAQTEPVSSEEPEVKTQPEQEPKTDEG